MRSLIVALIMVSCCCSARAQQPRKAIIAMNIELYATAPRSYGPILATLGFESRVPQLVDGTLHLRFLDDDTPLAVLRIPDIVISEAGYETTLVVPPLPESMSKGLDIEARFITSDGDEIVLSSSASTTDELTLLISPNELRGMLVGMVVSDRETEKSPPREFLAKNLLFETHAWQPAQTSSEAYDKELQPQGRISTTVTTLDPRVVPEDPLALCAFNVLAIVDEGLGSLKPKQLNAIVTWVRGGGRLCVVPDGFLRRDHSNFLTQLLSESSDPPPMTLDDKGDLVCDESLRIQANYGLGRVVVLSPKAKLETDIGEEETRKFVGFLWAVRRSQLEQSIWKMPPVRETYGYGYRPPTALATKRYFQRATTQLMPGNVRMVPLSLVGLLLGVYVFIVGPGDYLLLGLLKARRFTWVVFPLVTAAFTFALVAISNHYMSTTESGGQIEFNDVSTGGKVVRTSTIRLDFAAAAISMQDEAKAELRSGIDIRRAALEGSFSAGAMMQYDDYGNPVLPRIQQTNLTPAIMSGRFPSRYDVSRALKQWEPQMSRTFSFEGGQAPDLGFDWDNPGPIWTPDGRRVLNSLLTDAENEVTLTVMSGSQHYQLSMGFSDREKDLRARLPDNDPVSLVRSISAETDKFFNYVSAVSPHGGGTFEDLSMLDTSNSDEWLLLASWFDGSKQVVYRRLYSRAQLERPGGAK